MTPLLRNINHVWSMFAPRLKFATIGSLPLWSRSKGDVADVADNDFKLPFFESSEASEDPFEALEVVSNEVTEDPVNGCRENDQGNGRLDCTVEGEVGDEHAPAEEPPFYPIANPYDLYCPSFLTHDSDAGDFDRFLATLTDLSKRSRAQYMCDLRRWKIELNGDFSPKAIQAVIDRLSAHSAKRMLPVLNRYARHRNMMGDPRFVLSLAVNLRIKRPQKPKKQPITRQQKELYWALAESLCRKGKREGIWVGLSLTGVHASAIKEATVQDTYLRIPGKTEVKLPVWLALAMRETQDWARSRGKIWGSLKAYGCSPRELREVRNV